jgi:hypothetical protein
MKINLYFADFSGNVQNCEYIVQFFDISPQGPNKKAALPHPRQPGYL